MTDAVLLVMFGLMIITALAAIRLTDLFAVVIMFSIYSLLAASVFVVMDAVDVAFTEAAVGAGISTILMLGTLSLTDRWTKPSKNKPMLALSVVSITGAVLIYGTLDMPTFGDPQAPVHQHVAPHYLTQSASETGLPNVVTSVLASYRGYDTFGELTVIFTAGIGVLALLGIRRRKDKELAGKDK
ncbi:MAG: multicomponent Na+:H+ antiporter subunit B [Parasphingorhabdus sp.]|jgi:multicomponent Na+:H+ antiporter subunit B